MVDYCSFANAVDQKYMAINFHPKTGSVLYCDFNTGFKPPEMIKCRPVVVVSRGRGLVASVVPLSTVEPVPIRQCHREMSPDSLPTSLRSSRCWAKCDMVTCVALWRLDRVKVGKCPKTGKRIYVNYTVTDQDLRQIRLALRFVFGL